jgi:hypothetical protein
MGNQVLLGAIPMEGARSVDVNPDSPNMASGICMHASLYCRA